jgi:hypothetical protein
MAPRLDFSSWWVKDTPKGTPVVVKMENPSFSVVEINGADFYLLVTVLSVTIS